MKKVSFAPLHINESFKMLIATPKVGETMQTHFSDKPAVLLVFNGKISFLLGNESIVLSDNDSIEIPKNARHSFTVLEDSKCMLTLDATAKIQFER